jgi:DNA invertase Pin-like site-specific DNA recombinase
MSDDDQEGSIEQQRKEILAWAAGRYRIIREYVDAGKSGSKDQHRRTDFRRMVLDSGKGDFKAILCWKSNRFARLDSIDAGEHIKILRKHGVYLDTVKDGRMDWDTMEGRIMQAVRAEMDHAYSRSLASDSLRGRLDALAAGRWPNGSVPYGYHRKYTSPDGRTMIVRRTESFRKPTGWMLDLVVCEEEAAVVRWIFEQLTEHDRSLRSIARELNDRGVPSPTACGKGKGNCWTLTMLTGKRGLLANVAYAGFAYCGLGRTNKRGKFSTADAVRQAGACPVLIDPEQFERAQAILAARARQKRKPMKGSGALSGVLYCALCGRRMAATHWKGRLAYVCNSASLLPGEGPCKAWRVYEDEILPLVCSRLVQVVDGELVKALAATPPAIETISDLDMLKSRRDDLERQANEAAERYLKAPVKMMPRLAALVEKLQEELAEVEAKIQEAATAANDTAVSNFAKWWQEVRGRLLLVPVGAGESYEAASAFWYGARGTASAEGMGVGAPVCDADGVRADLPAPDASAVLVEPAALRGLLVRLGVKVECSFEHTGSKKKLTPGRGRGPSYFLKRAVLTWTGEKRENEADKCVYQ